MNEKLLEQKVEEFISKDYSNLNCGIQGIVKQSCFDFAAEETKEAREIIKGLLSVCDAELSPFAKEAYGDIFRRAEQFL